MNTDEMLKKMSFAELKALVHAGESRLAEQRDTQISTLATKWDGEAAELGLTPQQVMKAAGKGRGRGRRTKPGNSNGHEQE